MKRIVAVLLVCISLLTLVSCSQCDKAHTPEKWEKLISLLEAENYKGAFTELSKHAPEADRPGTIPSNYQFIISALDQGNYSSAIAFIESLMPEENS